MKRFILKRLLSLVFILLGVTFLTFVMSDKAPSDSAEMYYLSRGITPSETLLEKTREEMGLNEPLLVRYVDWLEKAVQGNLGESYHFGDTVWTQMTRKLPNTLKLAGGAFCLVVCVSIPLGIYCALYQNKKIDYLIRGISFMGISIPNFLLALLLIYVFAVKLGWLNVVSETNFKGMILPILTLSIPLICHYIRQIRISILEQLNKEYVIGALSKGLPIPFIMIHYVLPNAFTPIVTLFGLSVGHLLGGTAIVETLFSYQGIGSMVVEAIRVRDYPIIQGYVMWMALIYVVVNILVDIICFSVNPQQRLEGVKHEKI